MLGNADTVGMAAAMVVGDELASAEPTLGDPLSEHAPKTSSSPAPPRRSRAALL
jgi:hypothetical protein